MFYQMNNQRIIKNLLFINLVFIASLFQVFQTIDCKAAHSKRDADGSFSPRNHEHGTGDAHDATYDHKAILGSVKVVEEFKHLPPEVAMERLRTLAVKMDKNLDEKIDKTELKAWIFRSFTLLSEEESNIEFDENDVNKNEFITWNEYLDKQYGTDQIAKGESEDMKHEKALFLAADVNGDKKLSRKEYYAFSHPEENPDIMRETVIQSVFDSKDKNGDGKVDFQEYSGGRGDRTEWLKKEKHNFDTYLDHNNDGVLDEKEVYGWMVPDLEEPAEREANHLFSESDDDNDNFLSFDEIVAHHDIFTGSYATGSGEHLTSHKIKRFSDEL